MTFLRVNVIIFSTVTTDMQRKVTTVFKTESQCWESLSCSQLRITLYNVVRWLQQVLSPCLTSEPSRMSRFLPRSWLTPDTWSVHVNEVLAKCWEPLSRSQSRITLYAVVRWSMVMAKIFMNDSIFLFSYFSIKGMFYKTLYFWHFWYNFVMNHFPKSSLTLSITIASIATLYATV